MTAANKNRSDQDELPFPPGATASPGGPPKDPQTGAGAAGRGKGSRKAVGRGAGQADAEDEPYTGRSDPEMYQRLSRPWPTSKAGQQAMTAFFQDAHALRIKHGIKDVTILAVVAVNNDGKQGDIMSMHHSGDGRNSLPMVASAFRQLRENDRRAMIEMAGLAAPDVFVPSEAMMAQIERVTDALRDAIEKRVDGPWTISDTLEQLIQQGFLKSETHMALLDLASGKPRSPAEEIGVLRGEMRELLETTGSRVQRMAARIAQIEAEHPELKVPVPAPAPAPTGKTLKELDDERCEAEYKAAMGRRVDAGERRDPSEVARAHRDEHNWSLAMRLHDGEESARAEVNHRFNVLSGYLMLRGGTDFVTHCREAVREERWGALVHAIAALEDMLVHDKHLRWASDRDSAAHAEPTGEGRWSIPTSIDPGGPLL